MEVAVGVEAESKVVGEVGLELLLSRWEVPVPIAGEFEVCYIVGIPFYGILFLWTEDGTAGKERRAFMGGCLGDFDLVAEGKDSLNFGPSFEGGEEL